MGLFQYGEFTLHSGEQTWFKIDCDALDDEDLRVLALLIYEDVGTFGYVEGVPTGGTRLAEKLQQFASMYSEKLVIVDDVCTTGRSMEEQRAGRDAYGYTIFARGKCPSWVTPLFQMSPHYE
jgi:orotate phosphoribosyltransferase